MSTLGIDLADLVVLDASILGLVTNPNLTASNLGAKQWLETLLQAGIKVALPEIADYEIRRELLRADKLRGIRNLDILGTNLVYLPITTTTMRSAARLWSQLRKQGLPTSEAKSIDGDVLLAAQALTYSEAQDLNPVIATSNVSHISRLTRARHWSEIKVVV